MGRTAAVLVFAGSALLAIQARSFLTSAERRSSLRTFGWVTLLGAGLILLATLSLTTGAMVLSPEFGVLMVQGMAGWLELAVILLGASVWAGLALHAARVAKRERRAKAHPRRLWWIVLIAAVAGSLAAWRLFLLLLNADAPLSVRVYFYDLWSPPLLLWIAVSFMETVLRVCGTTAVKRRAFADVALVTGLGLWALHRAAMGFLYADPMSLVLWRWIVAAALPGFAWLGLRLATDSLGASGRLVQIARWGAAGLGALAGAAYGVLWAAGRVPFSLSVPGAAWLVLIGSVAGTWLVRKWRAGSLRIPDLGAPGRLDDAAMLLAAVVIVVAFADLAYFAQMMPVLDLAAAILACVLLLELLGGDPLGWISRDKETARSAGRSPLRAGWAAVSSRTSKAGGAVGGWLVRLLRIESWLVAVVKIPAAFLLLMFLCEIPNAGKTIIHPFSTSTGTPRAELGQLIADRLLNQVGLLQTAIQAHVPVPVQATGAGEGKGSVELRLNASGEGAGALDTQLGGNNVIELWGAKIPLSVILKPIKAPFRRALRITEIDGSYQSHSGRCVLFATSSAGGSWRVARDSEASRAPAGTGGATETKDNAGIEVEVAGGLADELAFQILAYDPGLAHLGMTRSWSAFERFQRGRTAFLDYQAGKPDALSQAISAFRSAIAEDGTFVLAHYWLGLAWRADGQPTRAADAFDAALRSRSDFVPAYLALADTLSALNRYYSAVPAALGSGSNDDDVDEARVERAVSLWYQVLQARSGALSQQSGATALYGLCEAALRPRRPGNDRAARTSEAIDIPNARNYLAYFYCGRAVAVLESLPAAERSGPDARDTMGRALNNMAVALVRSGRTTHRVAKKPGDWDCSGYRVSTENKVPKIEMSRYDTPYKNAARRYYERALTLLPANPVIRCNSASNGLASGDTRPMKDLARDPDTHVRLGDSLEDAAGGADEAVEAGAYYRLALDEYQAAIKYAPKDVFALNSYAYAFWNWRLKWSLQKPPVGPESAVAHQAEAYSRLAVKLAADNLPPATEAAVRDTLGEVLLAQGRPQEALDVFDQIRELKLLPEHCSYDEIRWDMAHAYMCAAWIDERVYSSAQQAAVYRRAANDLIKRIETNEQYREEMSFTRRPDLLDPTSALRVCTWSPDTAIETEPAKGTRYVLRRGQPVYESIEPACQWLGMTAQVAGAPNGVDLLQLHVWGGGVDRWISAARDSEAVFAFRTIRLGSQTRERHHYYFVQLADKDRKPVSPVYPIGTSADCSRNLISLTFDAAR